MPAMGARHQRPCVHRSAGVATQNRQPGQHRSAAALATDDVSSCAPPLTASSDWTTRRSTSTKTVVLGIPFEPKNAASPMSSNSTRSAPSPRAASRRASKAPRSPGWNRNSMRAPLTSYRHHVPSPDSSCSTSTPSLADSPVSLSIAAPLRKEHCADSGEVSPRLHPARITPARRQQDTHLPGDTRTYCPLASRWGAYAWHRVDKDEAMELREWRRELRRCPAGW